MLRCVRIDRLIACATAAVFNVGAVDPQAASVDANTAASTAPLVHGRPTFLRGHREKLMLIADRTLADRSDLELALVRGDADPAARSQVSLHSDDKPRENYKP